LADGGYLSGVATTNLLIVNIHSADAGGDTVVVASDYGNFTLDGGFWGVIATVRTPGAPYLSNTLNPQLSTIIISWPLSETSWQLQTTTNLFTTGTIWTDCSLLKMAVVS
jgi:hypothetical protein